MQAEQPWFLLGPTGFSLALRMLSAFHPLFPADAPGLKGNSLENLADVADANNGVNGTAPRLMKGALTVQR